MSSACRTRPASQRTCQWRTPIRTPRLVRVVGGANEPCGVDRACAAPTARRWAPLPRRRVTRCQSSSGGGDAQTTGLQQALRVELSTSGARSSIRFDLAPMGKGQAIVTVEVAAASEAEEAGVRPGMRLTAISDPIRRDEVWQLQDRPSLKNIRELLKMRSADTITLEFEPWDGATPSALAGGLLPLSPSGSAPGSAMASVDGESIGDRLARQYRDAERTGRTPTAVEDRQRRRREAMDVSDARDDRPLLLGLGLAFLLPPLVILAVAQGSGYLDSLFEKTLTGMR